MRVLVIYLLGKLASIYSQEGKNYSIAVITEGHIRNERGDIRVTNSSSYNNKTLFSTIDHATLLLRQQASFVPDIPLVNKSVSPNRTYLRGRDCFPENLIAMNSTRDAEDQLKRLLLKLRSFIDDAKFDEEKFGLVADSLNFQVAEADAWIEHLHSNNSHLIARVEFLKRAFQTMSEAFLMPSVFNMEGVAPRLTRRLISLNVALLNLYDDYGNPDAQIPGYDTALMGFRQILLSWYGIFGRLRDIPYGVKMLFHIQYARAKEMIETLESYLPGSEHCISDRERRKCLVSTRKTS